MTYQGTAILEPNLRHKSRTTVHPKAARLRVTLARAKSTGLEEFMKRDVYITLGEPALEEEPADSAAPDPADRVEEAVENHRFEVTAREGLQGLVSGAHW